MPPSSFQITASNRRLLKSTALAEVRSKWRISADTPLSFSKFVDIFLAASKTKRPDDVLDNETAFIKTFNSLRLFCVGAEALIKTDQIPSDISWKLNVYETYRKLLEAAWFSSQLSPLFAGIHLNTVRYVAPTELVLKQMTFSAKLVYGWLGKNVFLTTHVLPHIWSMDDMVMPGFNFEKTVVSGIRGRRARLQDTTWNNAKIEHGIFPSSLWHKAKAANIEIADSTFDGSNMRRVCFKTEQTNFPIEPTSFVSVNEPYVLEDDKLPTVETPQLTAGDTIVTEADRPTDLAIDAVDAVSRTAPVLDGQKGVEEISWSDLPDSPPVPEKKADVVDMPRTPTPVVERDSPAKVIPIHLAVPDTSTEKIMVDGDRHDTAPEISTVKTRIVRTSFRRIYGDYMDFTGAYLETITFEKAILKSARFDGATLHDIDFSDSDLTDATFIETIFSGKITFSRNTKVTLEQLTCAAAPEIAIEEWHRVFDEPQKPLSPPSLPITTDSPNSVPPIDPINAAFLMPPMIPVTPFMI